MPPKRAVLVEDPATPEAVYTAKFDWLMRWAMHFCGNDRQAAEDLVQDTFTQMLSSWHQIRNLDQPEQFLYSCLRYGFLRQRRLERRLVMEGLSSVDYESILVSARQARGQEMEWQTELRQVVTFLCWRKEAIKSASLLLLRFFHGLFPAEIARIAVLPRSAVYDAIDYARREAKVHLGDPKRLQVMGRGAPPASPAAPLLPTEQFVEELLRTIFASCQSPCMLPNDLLRRYEKEQKSPIASTLLAHLASCRRCLDVVCKHLGLPPTGSRSLEECLAPAPRMKFGIGKESASRLARSRSLRLARLRSQEAFSHRPRQLILYVNGNVVAARDVRSTVSELAVEMKGEQALEFLEVGSEQDLILFSAMLHRQPPDCGPEQIFRADLVDGRSLRVRLSYGVTGAQIELTYVDPMFPSEAEAAVDGREGDRNLVAARPGEGGRRVFWGRLRSVFSGWMAPALAVTAAAVVMICCWFLRKSAEQPNAHQVLAHAMQMPQGSGIEQQTVRIRLGEQSKVVTLHRDLARHRRPRREAVPDISPKLEGKLEVAEMNWSDPLSASSFQAWRARQATLIDTLEHRNGLVVLTTKVSEGPLRTSSLTLREADWHVVGRMASFADGERIDVAELDYSVIPWQHVDQNWFEAEATPPLRLPAKRSGFAGGGLASAAQLDEAEVAALLALARMDADSTERVQVIRGLHAISVAGAVADEGERENLQRALSGIPYVALSVRTFQEIEHTAHQPAETPPKLTLANAVAEPPPFDAWLLERKYSLTEIARMHAELLDAASELRQTEKARYLLDGRFDPHALTVQGQAQYEALRRLYLGRVAHASQTELALLQELQIRAGDGEAGDAIPGELLDKANRNAAICLRLISGNSGAREDPLTLLQELAAARKSLDMELQLPAQRGRVAPLTARGPNAAPLE